MGQSAYRSIAARPLARSRPARSDRHAGTQGANGARAGVPIFLQRAARTGGERFQPSTQAGLKVNAPGDSFEREADHVARQIATAPDAYSGAVAQTSDRHHSPETASGNAGPSSVARALRSSGQPLDAGTREFMEARFGTDLSRVRVHTGGEAGQLNRDLNAHAFTHGNEIFFGAGRTPARDALTAHELAHVIQQDGGLPPGRHADALGGISARTGERPIQCTFAASYSIPGSTSAFEIDLETREGALAAPPTQSGLDGYIRFVPVAGAPNSNVITMVQMARATDIAGADVAAASVPAAQAPRGALGTPGLRTQDDAARGIVGGFGTDVHHRPNAGAPGVPQGTFLSPRYNFQPAAPGTVGGVGQTAQPALYGGGIGGVVGQTPGFKRSDHPADIRSAVMYDFPGTNSNAVNVDFAFETVALGEDTMVTYGAVDWGFGLRAGHVVNERLTVEPGQSATFGEALERHRDFYVHEPVTFYFAFDSDVLSATEAAKIDTFLAYLVRNPDVHLLLEGFADIVGGPNDYNRNLSLRRAEAVESALLARGIVAARIDDIILGHGASTAATINAGSGDQGGDAAVGANQMREANRWANRRVILTFQHVPAAAPAARGGS